MTVSPDLARIYASAPATQRVIETLEISHPAFSRTYYITPELTGLAATLETTVDVFFQYIPFEVKLPDVSANGFQDLVISITNVDRIFTDELELASENPAEPIEFVYRAYSSTDLTQPGFVLPQMSATEVTADEKTISTKATIVDLVNRQFPFEIYTNRLFPMLANVS